MARPQQNMLYKPDDLNQIPKGERREPTALCPQTFMCMQWYTGSSSNNTHTYNNKITFLNFYKSFQRVWPTWWITGKRLGSQSVRKGLEKKVQ